MANTVTHKLSNVLTTFLEQRFPKWVPGPAASVPPGNGPGPRLPNALELLWGAPEHWDPPPELPTQQR